MLFAALGKPAPRYGHHSLILAPDGSKLSKRHGATSIGDFQGLGYLLGGHRQLPGPAQLAPGRRAREVHAGRADRGVRHRAGVQEPGHLRHPEAQLAERPLHPRAGADGALRGRSRPTWPTAGMEFAPVQREVVAEAVQANLVVLGDAPRFAEVFVEEADPATCAVRRRAAGPGHATCCFELARETLRRDAGASIVPTDEAREVLRGLVEAAKEQGHQGQGRLPSAAGGAERARRGPGALLPGGRSGQEHASSTPARTAAAYAARVGRPGTRSSRSRRGRYRCASTTR